MTKEFDIVYESPKGHFYATKERFNRSEGFKVWKNGITHATLAFICGYSGDEGMRRVREFCEQKEQDL